MTLKNITENEKVNEIHIKKKHVNNIFSFAIDAKKNGKRQLQGVKHLERISTSWWIRNTKSFLISGKLQKGDTGLAADKKRHKIVKQKTEIDAILKI